MHHALQLLGAEPFIAVNGDIWTDFDFARLPREPAGLAHLVMVENPAQHPRGDFSLDESGALHAEGEARLHVLRHRRVSARNSRRLATGHRPGGRRGGLAAAVQAGAAAAGRDARNLATGEFHDGRWTDVGTPERLAQLDRSLHD